MRSAMLRGLKDHAERIGQGKRAASITSEDVMVGAAVMLSVFVREPEFQGQTKDRLATAEAQKHRRTGDQGPVRSLAVGQSAAGQQAPGFRHRARRRAAAPPRREGNLTQDRGEETAPARQALRLHQHGARRLRALHRRGRLGRRQRQAGARPQDPGDPALARKNPQRRFRRQGQADRERAARRSDAGDRLRHARALPRRGSALFPHHHHDRRRRRRRAYRLAADHVLLPADAAADRRGPSLSGGAAALSSSPMAARRSMPATMRTRKRC